MPSQKNSKTKAARHNAGKPPISFVLDAPEAISGAAKVLEFGAQKYARHNWKKGLSYSSVIDCMLRHTMAFHNGEDIDPESGLPHVDHILCNAIFLSEFAHTLTGEDDRMQPQE